MKKLTTGEFHDRAQAIIRARRIFIPHLTKNISIAFEIYQEMLAETERKLRLDEERAKDYGILSEKQRPICPKCGKELFLRLIGTPQGAGNIHGYRSAWVCSEGDCIYEDFSKNTLQDWLEQLPQKETQDG